MKKITDLGQLSKLLVPWLKKGVQTNSYLLYQDYKQYIEQGVLYFTKNNSGMLILRDNGNHWQVYYYLSGLGDGFSLPGDKPSAMEMVFRTNSDDYQAVLAYWQDRGFEPYLPRKRMIVSFSGFEPGRLPGAAAGFAGLQHAPAIFELIAGNFDQYLGCIPSREEITAGIKKNEFICVKDAENDIKAVLEVGRRRNVFEIRHLVVGQKFRRCGLAESLLGFLKKAMEKEQRIEVRLWVRSDNLAARSLYEKVGFRYDGLQSMGLLYKP